MTPVLASTSPTTGNEGDTLTIQGHALSTTIAENTVLVGGQPCDVLSAQAASYSVPSCPVTSCTTELQTLTELTCRLPHLDSFAPHNVTVALASKGTSPLLAAATVTYSPLVRSITPASGSVSGGTVLTLYGDGLSERVGDLDVRLGTSRCRVVATNVSHITCISSAAAALSTDSTVAIDVKVRGVQASCPTSCTYNYAMANTPKLSFAQIVSTTASKWQVKVQGENLATPSSQNTIFIGSTPCIPTGTGSSLEVICESDPPLSGTQVVTLLHSDGAAAGTPTISGTTLSVSSLTPTTVSLAGGGELTIGGGGFSASDSTVTVCGTACPVTSVAATELKCSVPSLLLHEVGPQALSLINAVGVEYDVANAAQLTPSDTVTIKQGQMVALAFGGLNDTNLPRGLSLSHLSLHVTPQSGAGGTVIVDVTLGLTCSGDSLASIAATSSQSSTVQWDVQPYDLGFDADESPDLSSLAAPLLSARTTLAGCSFLVVLQSVAGPGLRTFYAPNATGAPELRIGFETPATSDQIAWTADKRCPVEVSVPSTSAPSTTLTCNGGFNSASSKQLADGKSCPHLELNATAATSFDSCDLTLNGLSLISGCGLDKLVVGRDGVCAAVIDPPNSPRAACFNTKVSGDGAQKLASWIDALPTGASAMIASCSRLSWAHDRTNLATALKSLGALNPPTSTDDAYALVGVKGGTSPLSEARTACCENPNPVCKTCSQDVAVANATVGCGVAITSSSSALASTPFGTWGSPSYVSAIIAASGSSPSVSASTAAAITSMGDVIASLQSSDVDQYDVVCDTSITDGISIPYGAALASDGDYTSYWLSAGKPDAVLTMDLGATAHVHSLTFHWKYPARSLLVLYSEDVVGDNWQECASVYQADISTVQVDSDLSTVPGVFARRLRLYLADAADSSWPVFGISELVADSCALEQQTVTSTSNLKYAGAVTPLVTSVSPRRGSTAGGTALTIAVNGLSNTVVASDISVTIAGVACAVTAATVGQVQCTTGSYGVTSLSNPGIGAVELTVAGVGTAAASASAQYEYLDLWSRLTTWGGKGKIPGLETSGDSIWIQTGQRIMLDCDINIYMLILQGTLEFDRVDINVDANYIFVMGGSFIIGELHAPPLSITRKRPGACLRARTSPCAPLDFGRYRKGAIPPKGSHHSPRQPC